ncbi:MAG: radical SAM protein [Clostridia bacterium]
MKLELIGHDEKYAVEQSLLTLFPDERPVYGPVTDEDASAARITLTEDADSVCVTTELRCGGKAAADCYSYPLSGTDYEKEGQRRLALGLSFFRAAKEVLGVTPAWGSLTGVRPSKVAVSLLREGKSPAAVLTELEEVYSVTPRRARLALEAAETGLRVQNDLKPNDISLYVGIPFCPTRCAYCSFVAQSVEKSFALVEPYLAALFDEIEQAGAMVRSLGLHIKSFYMGGGTPTTLTAEQMDRLLTRLERSFDFTSLAESTIEAGRPDTIDPEKLAVLRAHGVTRVSVNPQTMEDRVLAAIGRRHTADDIRRAMREVMAAGFPPRQHGPHRRSSRGHARGLPPQPRRGALHGRGQHHRPHAVPQKKAAASRLRAAASRPQMKSPKCWTMPTPPCVNMALSPTTSTARSICPAALKTSAGRAPAVRAFTTSTSWKSCTPFSPSARAARPRWSAAG